MLLQVYETVTLIISGVLAINSVKKTIRSNGTVYFIHLMFLFVFVIPLLLDHVIGNPLYPSELSGFIISNNDQSIRYLYTTYILLAQFVILIFGNPKLRIVSKQNTNYVVHSSLEVKDYKPRNKMFTFYQENSIYVDIVLCCAALASIVLVVIFPLSKHILWNFGWRDQMVAITGVKYYSTVEQLSYISVASAIIFLFGKGRRLHTRIIFAIVTYMSMCIEAKRSVMMFAGVVVISYLLFNTRGKTRKWVLLLCLIMLVGFFYYSVYVKSVYRGYSGFYVIYSQLRIDFFRDNTVKMAIYSLLNPHSIKILDYPGQSIITQIGYLFPLPFLKQISTTGYNAFFTCALIGVPLDRSIDFMTTSICDEVLADFGFFGFLIGPLVLAIFARISHNQDGKIIPVTLGLVMLLLMYSPSYIMWFIQFWFILTLTSAKLHSRKADSLQQHFDERTTVNTNITYTKGERLYEEYSHF